MSIAEAPAPAATPDTQLARHRVILCHFDSYSTALVFARWPDRSLLWPAPLPADARPLEAAPAAAAADVQAVLDTAVERLGLNPKELVHVTEFTEALQDADGPIHVHLLRFSTFEAPAALLAPHAAGFKPISELRGSAMAELNLLRTVFNLIISGGGRADTTRLQSAGR